MHAVPHVLTFFGLLWTKKKRSCAFWLLHNPFGTHFDTEVWGGFFFISNGKGLNYGTFTQSGKRKNITTCPGGWQKSLAFAHIATIRLDNTSALKLAHFIRSGRYSTATHATRGRSLFAITLQAEQIFAIL